VSKTFNAYAVYYDLLYRDKDYQSEAAFVKSLLDKNSIRSDARILELGCGTGKHAFCFASLGYRVDGIDLSPTMIEAAVMQTPDEMKTSVSFSVGDVRDVVFGRSFDAVVSLFHVASYQTTNSDLQNMFASASRHLDTNGVFIFDCWYGPAVLFERPEARTKTMSSDDYEVIRSAVPVIDVNRNCVEVQYSMRVRDKKDSSVAEIKESHCMRYLFLPEVELILEAQGMRLVDSVEWGTSADLSQGSWYATFVAVKVSAS
jgi:SAM-dependent methyltransferase